MLYVIQGNPYHLYKNATTIMTPKAQRTHFQVSIESLFEIDNDPFDDVPVQLFVTFFLPFESLKRERSQYLHVQRMPPLAPMITYLTRALKGLAYVHDHQVASIIANKVYDKQPRTELRITELLQ